MPAVYLTLGPWTMQTYSLAVALGIIASIGIGVYRLRSTYRPGAVVDVYLGGLIGGLVLARLFHVILNWNYFVDNLSEAARPDAGGLDWHGAVIGGFIGMGLVARWRRVYFRDILDTATFAPPLIALGGWYGCLAAHCAFGAEVSSMADYPAILVWEGPDIYGIFAPRFHTQALGLALAGVLLVGAFLTVRISRLRGRRFWLVLALLSIEMFTLGFMRGDFAFHVIGLRLDQWLDIGLLAVSGWQAALSRNTLYKQ